MNRKWLACLSILMMTMIMLTGCGADQKAVTETTENFLQALVDSDLDTAREYASEELFETEKMKLLDRENLENSFYDAIGMEKESVGEDAQKAVSDYVGRVVESAYRGYEIGDIKIQGDTAYVTAKIDLGFDPEAESNLAQTAQEEIAQYQKDNYDDLVNVYIDEGEQALYNKLYNDLLPIIVTKMTEELDQNEGGTESTVLTLTKTEGTWKVTELQETGSDASDAETAQAAENSGTAGEGETQ